MTTIPLTYEKKFHTPVPKGNPISFLKLIYLLQPNVNFIDLLGPYVVGCTDLMVGPYLDTGCFFRLFYPTELQNVYVIILDTTLKLYIFT